MEKYVWLIGLLLELCNATDSGCCGLNAGVCIKCCSNYHLDNGTCQECPPGFSGDRCRKKCAYPWYGVLCGFSCNMGPKNCSRDDCHPAVGCQSNGVITWTTINRDSELGTAEFIQGHKKRTTNGSELFMNTPESTYYSIVTRNSPTKHVNAPAGDVIGKDFKSKDALRMVSVVKSLGYTLGLSLLVILGLICHLICKKRREFKSMIMSQPSEQEFRSMGVSTNQTVNHGSAASRNSINSPPVYQDHSEIVLVREADGMDRIGSAAESKTTTLFMDMKVSSDQNTVQTTSVDNPFYAEIR